MISSTFAESMPPSSSDYLVSVTETSTPKMTPYDTSSAETLSVMSSSSIISSSSSRSIAPTTATFTVPQTIGSLSVDPPAPDDPTNDLTTSTFSPSGTARHAHIGWLAPRTTLVSFSSGTGAINHNASEIMAGSTTSSSSTIPPDVTGEPSTSLPSTTPFSASTIIQSSNTEASSSFESRADVCHRLNHIICLGIYHYDQCPSQFFEHSG